MASNVWTHIYNLAAHLCCGMMRSSGVVSYGGWGHTAYGTLCWDHSSLLGHRSQESTLRVVPKYWASMVTPALMKMSLHGLCAISQILEGGREMGYQVVARHSMDRGDQPKVVRDPLRVLQRMVRTRRSGHALHTLEAMHRGHHGLQMALPPRPAHTCITTTHNTLNHKSNLNYF